MIKANQDKYLFIINLLDPKIPGGNEPKVAAPPSNTAGTITDSKAVPKIGGNSGNTTDAGNVLSTGSDEKAVGKYNTKNNSSRKQFKRITH